MKKRHILKEKKLIILIILVITLLFILYMGVNYLRRRNAIVKIVLKDNLNILVYDKVKVSDLVTKINGKIKNDYYIDTKSLGEKVVNVLYINDDNITVNYKFKVKIIDNIAPLVLNTTSVYDISIGSGFSLYNDIFCGDNYDSKPTIEIIGDYDLNKEGVYNISFIAIDSSGNYTKRNLVLNVYEKEKDNNKNIDIKNEEDELSGTLFQDVVEKYKKNNNKIGIDISKWQKEIDFKAIKDSGVEFIFIRVGGSRGVNKDYFEDEYFKRNMSEVKKYNIPVGIYFYSYSNSISKAKSDAKWVLSKIKKYKEDISLGVAYDFEDWSNFNSYNVSFYELTNIASTFMDTIKKGGYKSLLYGSKNYLENVFMDTSYPVWLAHYTMETDYSGDYKYWQLCNDGLIDGIDTYVDIDIMY